MKKTKKLFVGIAVFMLMMCVLCFGASAAEKEGYYTYTVSGGKATVTDVDASISGDDVIIPDTLGGYSVVSIGRYAFEYCTKLTGITIPDSVTSIGYGAFYGCRSLESVTIGDSVTSIGGYAFQDCRSLKSITIGSSVKSIDICAFGGCTSLESIIIPDSVTSIGVEAFSGCSSLASIIIPDSITSIGDAAFAYCKGLTGITVDEDNENYLSDEYGVLYNKDKTVLIQYPSGNTRTSYIIPDGVTGIGHLAFRSCTSLENIEIPDSVTSIDNYTFFGCTSLESITIPDGVTSINEGVFNGCTGLTNITIPESIVIIGKDAFQDCESLESITIPGSVRSIGESAFVGCSSLTGIIVDENNKYFSNDEYNVLFNKDKSELIQYPLGSSITTYAIPGSVKSIGANTFYLCESIENVKIGDGVTSIGNLAFYGCRNLKSVTIPDSVTSIGTNAFGYCESISTAHYCGTQEQWDAVSVGYYNNYLTDVITMAVDENNDGACDLCTDLHTCVYTAVKTEATCTANGQTVYTCSCGDTYTEIIPTTGHDYQDGVCTKCGDSKVDDCSHLCHKSGFMGFIWKIINFFQKLFKSNPVCECGLAHY